MYPDLGAIQLVDRSQGRGVYERLQLVLHDEHMALFRPQTEREDFMEASNLSSNGSPHLTQRQTQIVVLIAEDLTAKEIGRRVGISPKTVELHRDLIRKQLGVAGTAGIVRYAIKSGLIEP